MLVNWSMHRYTLRTKRTALVSERSSSGEEYKPCMRAPNFISRQTDGLDSETLHCS